MPNPAGAILPVLGHDERRGRIPKPAPVVALGELQPNGQRSPHATLPGGTMKIFMLVGHDERSGSEPERAAEDRR